MRTSHSASQRLVYSGSSRRGLSPQPSGAFVGTGGSALPSVFDNNGGMLTDLAKFRRGEERQLRKGDA